MPVGRLITGCSARARSSGLSRSATIATTCAGRGTVTDAGAVRVGVLAILATFRGSRARCPVSVATLYCDLSLCSCCMVSTGAICVGVDKISQTITTG